MSISDREVYDAIVSALAGIRSFGAVVIEEQGRGPGGPSPSPMAVVSPGPWTDTFTDDPATALRRVSYRVTISVRGDDPRARFSEADRLSREALALLDGADFGGGCIPALSLVDRGECRASVGGGEASCELKGTFSYFLPHSSGFVSTRQDGPAIEELALVTTSNNFAHPQTIQVSTDAPALAVGGVAGMAAPIIAIRGQGGSTVSGILGGGEFRPPTLDDPAASNNAIYFSSTLGRLVYKDTSGSIRPLD